MAGEGTATSGHQVPQEMGWSDGVCQHCHSFPPSEERWPGLALLGFPLQEAQILPDGAVFLL